jgi:hypothetical protein
MSYYFGPWDFAIGRVPAQITNYIRRALGQFLNRFNQHFASREYFQTFAQCLRCIQRILTVSSSYVCSVAIAASA